VRPLNFKSDKRVGCVNFYLGVMSMENIPLKGTVPATFNSIESAPPKKDGSNHVEDPDGAFLCNVCLEQVKDRDPVVTQCGHLYCWPCLYRWLNTHHSTCPVCKAGVTQDNVIPIFIRGSVEDPRIKTSQENIPNRPGGHRPDPVNSEGANNNPINIGYNFGGISFSAGFGFFPSLFGLQFQSFAPAGSNAAQAEEEAQQAYLSRVLLVLGVAVILCLLFF
jgi:E3 ubiquitin-protein ligase RNF5